MPELLLVPEVAAGATEVVIGEWLVQPGADFSSGDAIAVIETDKAVVEVEADRDGILLKPLVAPGTSIEVGLPLALVGSADEAGIDVDAALASLGHDGGPAGTPAPERREVPDAATPGAAEPPPAPDAPAGDAGTTPRVFISPLARKLLREAGLSPEGLVGSGPRGRIRRRDVEGLIARHAAAVDGPAAPETPEAPAASGWTDVPHSRLRRAVARRLTESKQQVPHFYLKRSVRLDALLALRSEINEVGSARISVNDFLIRAMALAHVKVPEANVVWTEDAVRRFDHVDIAVAVASERGLVTPVLRAVETSSLSAISAQVRDAVDRANRGALQQSELEGGSITISNLGMYGVDEFAAIINPPQSLILAVGAGRQVAVVEEGDVCVGTVAELVLSADHRAVDGALAARWMEALVEALHHPLTLLV